jgi:predicted CxxxxCH...CXXCH cytochrome family protein
MNREYWICHVKWLLVLLSVAACADPRVLSQPCVGDACVAHVHPDGWVDAHGSDLGRRNWDFALCQGCHGDDYQGGTSGVSCLSCHAEGPTACTTCHGNGPTSNAHPTHQKLDCSECHVKPASWDAPGHIKDVPLGAPAPVVFGALANTTLAPADRKGPAAFDGTTCSNVYCHGAALHAPGGTNTSPRWDDPTPAGTCGTCHAKPPPSHLRSDCATCHPASAPHIDGVLQIGKTGGCDGCHGSPASAAPPSDLSGNVAITAIGVGAHQAHLNSSVLRGPIACSTCHVVPQTVTDPGHLLPAPAAVVADVAWDRTTQTCGTWCHGSVSPVWTTQGGATCGSCHGVPPSYFPHSPTMTLTDCHSCHAQTIDAAGQIIVTNGTSTHMNGVWDAN